MRRALVVFVVVTAATSGCAWRSDVKRLRADVDRLTENVSAVQAQQMVVAGSDEAVHKDITSINARLGRIEPRINDTATELTRLETRLAAAEQVVQTATARLDALATTVAKLEASAATPPPAPAQEVAPSRAMTAEQMYANALTMFRAREHGQAVLDFLDFLARYPNHRLAPAAQYWIGEAYFVQRDYRQAIVEYDKVLNHGLKNSKVPDALLRVGMSWKALRDQTRAVETWHRVVNEFPKSAAARKAEALLAGVGGGSAPLAAPPPR
jgi:tol-pal system protein YbgF